MGWEEREGKGKELGGGGACKLEGTIGQCRSAPSTEQAPNESEFNKSNE